MGAVDLAEGDADAFAHEAGGVGEDESLDDGPAAGEGSDRALLGGVAGGHGDAVELALVVAGPDKTPGPEKTPGVFLSLSFRRVYLYDIKIICGSIK